MTRWKTVRLSDIVPEPKKTGPHKGRLMKWMSRVYCTQCGLVRLRNKVSEKAWRKKCVW